MTSDTPPQLSQQARQDLKRDLLQANDAFVRQLPKVELHIHLEGTLTAEVRWKIAQRRGVKPRFGKNKQEYVTLAALKQAYSDVISSAQLKYFLQQDPIPATFFEAYYSGFDSLQTAEDFYDVAISYFTYAASVNVRYCEVFFDPQGHTSRGVQWDDMMSGLRRAQQEAAERLNVKAQWIMSFLRDQSPESAMQHYKAALKYKDMIVGFGLDSNEFRRPPWLFDEVFAQARRDGFKITAHCDVGVENTHQHIRHVATGLGGSGAPRIDHGLNAADQKNLTALILDREVSMTICPWAYLRRESYESIGQRLQVLLSAGIKVCISSDSPAYMESAFLLPNLLLAKKMCGLSNADMLQIVRNSVDMSWASEEVKTSLHRELDDIVPDHVSK